MIDVTLLGTGGMMPLPARALTALYVRCGSQAILIDCGEGTQTAIRACGLRFKPIEGILITHFHADHISGLPGLLLTLGNETRTEPLHLYGPAGLCQIVNGLCVITPELPFELVLHELNDAEQFELAGMTVDAFPAKHGIPCFGYKLTKPRPGKFDAGKARRGGIPQEYWNRLQRGETCAGFSPEDVLGPPRKGISLLYATDTRPVPEISVLGKGVDLLILEGMYGDKEKQDRAEDAGHMMMHEAAQIARDADVSELWLTHYSPATPEPQEYEGMLKAIFPQTVISADGQTKTLVFAKD